MYIFLDESGQFSKHNHEEYFVIGSFAVDDIRNTTKKMRSFYKKHFPRKMKNQSEIKWSTIGISDDLRLKTIKYISKLDIIIKYVYLLRNNIPTEYRKEDKLKDGLLYTNVVGQLIDLYLPSTDNDFRVFCDQRKLSGMNKDDFKRVIESRVMLNMPKGSIVQIETVNSVTNVNIQIADWVSGVIARYLEGGKLGKECYALLKEKIMNDGKELFNRNPVLD